MCTPSATGKQRAEVAIAPSAQRKLMKAPAEVVQRRNVCEHEIQSFRRGIKDFTNSFCWRRIWWNFFFVCVPFVQDTARFFIFFLKGKNQSVLLLRTVRWLSALPSMDDEKMWKRWVGSHWQIWLKDRVPLFYVTLGEWWMLCKMVWTSQRVYKNCVITCHVLWTEDIFTI